RDVLPDAHLARINNHVFLRLATPELNRVRDAMQTCFSRLRETGLKVENIEVPAQLLCGLCVVDAKNTTAEAMLRVNLAFDLCADGDTAIVIAEHNESDIFRELQTTQVAGGLENYIKMGRFFLVAQPIVDMTRKNAKPSFEMLLRMKGESGETISPAQFVPAAEKLGVMSSLDRFVLSETFRLVKQGRLPLEDISHISINLSGSSLNDMNFLSDIYHLITSTRIDLSNFCFEVTESVALNSFNRTKEFLSALQDLGAKTAIDDFGAGHSSIHYLSELSPNYLKLDGSLITKILTQPIHRSFTEKMIELTKEMNVICIAEYVETIEHEKALLAMGARFGQGYYYAAPLQIEAVRGFCAEWAAAAYLQQVKLRSEHID
ncbi:MAG: EAL domain-containing protein, partial [Burkholderiaceae bacterium]